MRAIFCLISRNETKGVHSATKEEFLQEIIDELKDALELDLKNLKDPSHSREEDYKIKYTTFLNKVKLKADFFKQNSNGYRRICCLPSFSLGLVMASRILSHYTHAPWFKLRNLSEMIGVHGTVSDPV